MASSRAKGRSLVTLGRCFWRLCDVLRQFRQRQLFTRSAALGRRGEDLAHRYLESRGFAVVCRNYRAKGGSAEIDIVARENQTLVFVEVKSRTSDDFGTPDRAIDLKKQKRILKTARNYVLRAEAKWSDVRFDVVTIVFTSPPSLEHHRDVFFRGRAIGL